MQNARPSGIIIIDVLSTRMVMMDDDDDDDDDDDLRCHNLPLDQERFLQSEWNSESLVHSFVSLAQQFPSES